VHDVQLLVNIAVALAYALAGGLLARRLGLPTIVGYLVAGVALGPFTPGFRGDERSILLLAEVGVILLMFGVGLHFSFRDLWQVRRIAIPGAALQMALAAAVGAWLARLWGFSAAGAWVFGIAISVASTVVLLRMLMDYGWLDTPTGKIAVGWLIVEDLAMVAILVLLPVFAVPHATASWTAALAAIGKAVLFVALMMFAGDRVVPALLGRVAHMRSRELFVLVALTIAVGTALASAAYFGVSLALGAFVAGIVVGKSPFSHQIGADLLPFREAFAVIFFVSIGMLVNPSTVAEQWQRVAITTAFIVVGKGVISGALAWALGSPAHTVLVLAAGRGQIGEFSFIVGQVGLALGAIDNQQYSLILASAMLSILINPFVVRLVEPAERRLRRWPQVWRRLDRPPLTLPLPPGALTDHVVIVGCGRVGRHIAEALGRLGIPRLVVEADPTRLDKLRELGVPVLYGDASSSDILEHADLDRARACVITLPDDAAALSVVATARIHAPNVRIVARASTWEGARRLRAEGVRDVVRPELEGGVEIVRRTLLDLDLPVREVQRYTELVRREGLDESERPSPDRARVLEDLVRGAQALEVVWLDVIEASPVAGRTLAELALRTIAGVSVVAIGRGDTLIGNPAAEEALRPGDRIAVIGTPAQVTAAERLLGTVPVSATS
jgi:CPA2 family monovalent cation:H+ antiporter-2